MAGTWFSNVVLFFRPEDSSPLAHENYLPVPEFRTVNEKIPADLKALVWTMISIMAGLIVGQLS